jgi:hypothetical protein
VETETQRPDNGQIASREHSRSRWYRGDWCVVFESVSKVGMDLLFVITAGKKVIFLANFSQENCPDLTCCKITIFSFVPNSGMKAIWPRYFIHFIGRRIIMTYVLIIVDKCINL